MTKRIYFSYGLFAIFFVLYFCIVYFFIYGLSLLFKYLLIKPMYFSSREIHMQKKAPRKIRLQWCDFSKYVVSHFDNNVHIVRHNGGYHNQAEHIKIKIIKGKLSKESIA